MMAIPSVSRRTTDVHDKIFTGHSTFPISVLGMTFSESGGYEKFVTMRAMAIFVHRAHPVTSVCGKPRFDDRDCEMRLVTVKGKLRPDPIQAND
jgi:hypothetical protein